MVHSKKKTETGSNCTVPVFLQYVISSLMHQKLWVFQKKIQTEIKSFFNLQKDFQKRKLIIFFPPLTLLHVCHTIYPRTPIDIRHSLTSQDALYMVRKSFNLFYMINYHEIITLLVCITVSHRRTYKFYYPFYLVNSTSPCL